jgi:hypothetical protein
MTKSGLEKKFEAMDRRIKRLRAMLPAEFNCGDDDKAIAALDALDDDQFATVELISEEIGAALDDMENLLCGR